MSENNLEGAVLGDRFEVGEFFSSGGEADLYWARDRATAVDCLVRMPGGEFGRVDRTVETFRRSARVAAELSGEDREGWYFPKILAIGDCVRVGCYMAMECFGDCNLKALLLREGRLSTQRFLHLGLQLADILEFLHSRGMVFRDLKPENVLIGEGDEVKLTDFGLCVPAELFAKLKVVRGTPEYLAPEVWTRAQRKDHHADLYALGVLFYELLSGRPPFTGPDQVVELGHISKTPAPISGVDADVASLVGKLLEKDSARRFANAGKVRDVLMGLL